MAKKKKVELKKPLMTVQDLESACLFDDVFMNECFKLDPKNMQHVLRIITGQPQLRVAEVDVQKHFENPHGHSTRFDGYARAADGALYASEVQQAYSTVNGHKQKRFTVDELLSRASHGLYMLGSEATGENKPYKSQREHTLIYILDENVLGQDIPVVEFSLAASHDPALRIPNGRILFVNGEYRDEDTELGRLMHDFAQRDPDNMHDGPLKDTAIYFKRTSEGRAHMVGTLTDKLHALAEEMAKDTIAESKQRIRALTIIEEYLIDHIGADSSAVVERLCHRIKGLSRTDAEAYLEAYNNGERVS